MKGSCTPQYMYSMCSSFFPRKRIFVRIAIGGLYRLCHLVPFCVIQYLSMSFSTFLCHSVPFCVIQYLSMSFSTFLCPSQYLSVSFSTISFLWHNGNRFGTHCLTNLLFLFTFDLPWGLHLTNLVVFYSYLICP